MMNTQATHLVPLIAAVYRQHAAGCTCWHVVLDDRNVTRAHVDAATLQAVESGHPACMALADALASGRYSLTQVRKACALYDANFRGKARVRP